MVDNMKRELRMSIYVYFRSDHLSLSTVAMTKFVLHKRHLPDAQTIMQR